MLTSNGGATSRKQLIKSSKASEVTTLGNFSQKLPIVVRAEASYTDRIVAGLFQRTHRGLLPVQLVSRTLNDVDKRCSQTDQDALAVNWEDRLSIYLLGGTQVPDSGLPQTTHSHLQLNYHLGFKSVRWCCRT